MRFKIASLLCVCVFGLVSCKQNVDKTDKNTDNVGFTSIGKSMTTDGILEPIDAILQYEVLQAGDTVTSKIIGKVTEVCQSKGCWMVLDLGDESEVMVTFKDYGFFVPIDIVGKEVIVNGNAYIDNMSVAQQQHYAKDAGKTPAEIASIVQPKTTWAFEADGVMIKE